MRSVHMKAIARACAFVGAAPVSPSPEALAPVSGPFGVDAAYSGEFAHSGGIYGNCLKNRQGGYEKLRGKGSSTASSIFFHKHGQKKLKQEG